MLKDEVIQSLIFPQAIKDFRLRYKNIVNPKKKPAAAIVSFFSLEFILFLPFYCFSNENK